MRKMHVIVAALVAICLFAGTAYLCGPQYTFRAYLDKRFWQPFAMYEESVFKAGSQKDKEKGAKQKQSPYAGYSTSTDGAALSGVRKAYIGGRYEQARVECAAAEKLSLIGKEREELALIDAKLDMRMAEGDAGANKALLQKARGKLEAFLRTAGDPAFKSEARGWLGRVNYLLGDYAAAVKIYLDEMQRQDSIFDKKSLSDSLHTIFPYNGSSARLADHLDEYFDTPEHALFVVYIVTNPVYERDEERAGMAKVAQQTIQQLQTHSSLFDGSKQSDALVLALMRVSIYGGDTSAALTYSRKLSSASPTAATPEFNWMVAACHFLQREYAQAEAPLLRIVRSKQTGFREMRSATRALVGVYQKLGRPVDQLHAAFLYETINWPDRPEVPWPERCIPELAEREWLMDLPYLLDIQLTDDELREYLARYGKEAKQVKYTGSKRKRTAFETVKYALAVRLARDEKYGEAATIYERLAARPRAVRMRVLADLYAKTTYAGLSREEHQKALYDYASFLEAHSVQVFFNDMVWDGFQTFSFIDGEYSSALYGLTGEEMDRFRALERRVQDRQEERWRAYIILRSLLRETGHTELGKQAAIKAIRCLDMIHTSRFGRVEEINQGREELLTWLSEHRRARQKAPSGA